MRDYVTYTVLGMLAYGTMHAIAMVNKVVSVLLYTHISNECVPRVKNRKVRDLTEIFLSLLCGVFIFI